MEQISIKSDNTSTKPYLDFLINQMFQAVNGISVLRFENKDERTIHAKYYLPAIEIKDFNVSIGGRNLFDQPVENYLRTFDNNRKISIGQVHDYTTGFLLEYIYFQKYYKMIETDLSKQKHLM